MLKKVTPLIGAVSYLASAAFALANAQANPQISPVNLQNVPGAIPSNTTLNSIIQFIITLMIVAGTIIAIAFLIYGGIKWVMSGGDKSGVEAARNHIVAAIVGLVIILGAFLILNIVWTLITGQSFSINNICIPTITHTCQK